MQIFVRGLAIDNRENFCLLRVLKSRHSEACSPENFCCVLRQAFDLMFGISIDSKKNEDE
ncbi:hypothetical protein T01_2168 [Trichinella spiralis]|uniref:Uncharacterized protein n=1 Tax=Trichinella spiralis TaxID=6334 RepID=A0A0V1AYG3_TRISP|nr:hypothetical protein T01_15637 [Trichinella spiralis]KRY29791.1 hypothetical protein T01_2168 [Trichinella spiralis]